MLLNHVDASALDGHLSPDSACRLERVRSLLMHTAAQSKARFFLAKHATRARTCLPTRLIARSSSPCNVICPSASRITATVQSLEVDLCNKMVSRRQNFEAVDVSRVLPACNRVHNARKCQDRLGSCSSPADPMLPRRAKGRFPFFDAGYTYIPFMLPLLILGIVPVGLEYI